MGCKRSCTDGELVNLNREKDVRDDEMAGDE